MTVSYLFQVMLFQFVFLVAYWLLLKRQSFHTLNRYFLLFGFFISFSLPFFQLDLFPSSNTYDTVIKLPEVYITNAANELMPSLNGKAISETDTNGFFNLVWLLGIVTMTVLFIVRIHKLYAVFKKSKPVITDGRRYRAVSDSYSAFSFFNSIFIGDKIADEDISQIIEHEKVHVREKHSLDILVIELLKIPFWFNPFIFIYQRELILVHEYEADAVVSPKVSTKEYYLNLLSQTFEVPKSVLINSFSKQSILKQRIAMITKNKSPKTAMWNYLIIVPILCALVLYVSCEAYDVDSDNNIDRFSYTIEKDAKMTPEIEKIHNDYEAFLFANPDYVSWAVVDENNQKISYSVHKATEIVPEGFTKLMVSGNSQSYVMYMNFPHIALSEVQMQKTDQNVEVPYAVIEVPPVFEGCEDISDTAERRKCTSAKVSEFVGANFNTNLASNLGLVGRQRINVIFKIAEDGSIKDVRARAPIAELEEEAIRVVSALPKFTPGEQKGNKVAVPYSLPIVFQVND